LLIVGNGYLVTLGADHRVINGGAVAVENGLIVEVGTTGNLRAKHKKAEFLDADGAVIMPGLINIHAHGYGAFARGMSIPGDPPRTFLEILQGLWWKLDRALTPEDVHVSGALGFVDSLKNGTTTVFDHHASPNAINGSLDEVAEAAGQVGVRACLCYEVSDRDGPERAAEGIEENLRFIRSIERPKARGGVSRPELSDLVSRGGSRRSGMLAGCVGLHASLTLSDATLGRAVEGANKLGVGCHIHVAEGPEDGADSVARYGRSVVKRLADLGVLGPRSIAAHCVHVDQEDIDLLASTRTIVAHNAQSNMSNAVGVAPALAMAHSGVRVGPRWAWPRPWRWPTAESGSAWAPMASRLTCSRPPPAPTSSTSWPPATPRWAGRRGDGWPSPPTPRWPRSSSACALGRWSRATAPT